MHARHRKESEGSVTDADLVKLCELNTAYTTSAAEYYKRRRTVDDHGHALFCAMTAAKDALVAFVRETAPPRELALVQAGLDAEHGPEAEWADFVLEEDNAKHRAHAKTPR